MTNGLFTQSPCIGICSTTFGDDICFGCKRTYQEVIEWNAMSDEAKDKINRRLSETISPPPPAAE